VISRSQLDDVVAYLKFLRSHPDAAI
jgi:hypothetical protein